jgi:hypothetical protein
MTNYLLNEMTLDNCRGTYFLSPQAGPSRYIFANPPHFDQFEKLLVIEERHKTWAVNMGIDAHPAIKGLTLFQILVYVLSGIFCLFGMFVY